jgi:hypothetical protein
LGDNSFCRNFTLGIGGFFQNFTLVDNSSCQNFTLGNSSSCQNFTLVDNSSCRDFTFGNSIICRNFTFGNNIYCLNFTLGNNSSINLQNSGTITQNMQNLTIKDNCNVNVDISAATTIYQTFPKTIFARQDGTPRLSYYNNSDVLVIVPVNN